MKDSITEKLQIEKRGTCGWSVLKEMVKNDWRLTEEACGVSSNGKLLVVLWRRRMGIWEVCLRRKQSVRRKGLQHMLQVSSGVSLPYPTLVGMDEHCVSVP